MDTDRLAKVREQIMQKIREAAQPVDATFCMRRTGVTVRLRFTETEKVGDLPWRFRITTERIPSASWLKHLVNRVKAAIHAFRDGDRGLDIEMSDAEMIDLAEIIRTALIGGTK